MLNGVLDFESHRPSAVQLDSFPNSFVARKETKQREVKLSQEALSLFVVEIGS